MRICLQGLNASNNLITTLNPLKYLLHLEHLVISSNKLCGLFEEDPQSLQRDRLNPSLMAIMREHERSQIKGRNLKPLPPLLRTLDVSFNPLDSLKGIEHCNLLETVDCSACLLAALEPELSQLKELTALRARKNKIANVADVTAGFAPLTSLTHIDLSGNPFVAKDEQEGKGTYYLAMLELSKGRLKVLDDRNILEKDYKRYESLKSQIQCEELVAQLNVECSDTTLKLGALLDSLSSRHRQEEEVLRGAIRTATMAEKNRCSEYTNFVNQRLRDLKVKEQMSADTVGLIASQVQQMKSDAVNYTPDSCPQSSEQDTTSTDIDNAADG